LYQQYDEKSPGLIAGLAAPCRIFRIFRIALGRHGENSWGELGVHQEKKLLDGGDDYYYYYDDDDDDDVDDVDDVDVGIS
jgi:hypothetical protein